MAEAEIKIGIKADHTAATAAFEKVAVVVDKASVSFEKIIPTAQKAAGALGAFGSGVGAFVAPVTKATTAFGKFSDEAKKVPTSLSKIPQSSNQATNALMNLSRVAQDAPYGFMGIANNLNPLLESMQRLTATSGGAGAALKALGGVMTGPAGIGLALGVVSSLVVAFGDDLIGSSKKVDDIDAGLKRLNKTLEDSKQKFQDLSDAIADMQRLGDINLKIRGLDNRLGLQGRSLDFNELLSQAEKDRAAIVKKIEDLGKVPTIAEGMVDDKKPKVFKLFAPVIEPNLSKIKEAVGKQTEVLEKALTEQDKKIKELREGQRINFAEIRLDQVEDQKDADEKAKAAAEKAAAERDRQNAKLRQQLEAARKYWEDYHRAWQRLKFDIEKGITNPDFNLIPEQPTVPDYSGAFIKGEQQRREAGNQGIYGLPSKEQLAQMQADIQKTTEGFRKQAEVISGYLTPAFAGMFDAITAGENPLMAFFDGLGQAVNRLIQQLVQAAIQAAVLSLITAGGSDAIGFGAAFSKNIGKLFGGGIASPGAAGFGNGVRGALNSVNGTSFRGTGMSVNVTGTLQGRGSNLVAVISQTTQQQNRNF